jgi:hypothetical protein
MSTSTASELSRLVQTMQRERQQHADAIAAIDATFAGLGITPKVPAKRGRKPGAAWKGVAAAAAPKKRRGRRAKAKDGKTGEQFIIDYVSGGAKTTAEVNKGWSASGRNGRADILLGKLVSGGKLKRQKIKGERGSRYSAA